MGRTEIEVVVENLRLWQDQIKDVRLFDLGPEVRRVLLENAERVTEKLGRPELLAEAHQSAANRKIRLRELEELYGAAVYQVEGAETQDLFILDEVGLLLLEVEPGAHLSYFIARVSGERYLDEIRRRPAQYRSQQAERARIDAQECRARFDGGIDEPQAVPNLENDLTKLSPEARMLFWEKLISADPSEFSDSNERSRRVVVNLLRGGRSTVGDLRGELASMSPENRADAVGQLICLPEYRIKGIRWNSTPYPPEEHRIGRVTGYQRVVDSVREEADPNWWQAVSIIRDSKRQAGQGQWALAAVLVQGAISMLERLASEVSPLYKHDLAVAHYHLEAYHGHSADPAGARAAIERSLALLLEVRQFGSEESIEFDVAKAFASKATVLADAGDLAGAVRCQSESITALGGLANIDWQEFGPEFAWGLARQALFLFHSGSLSEASSMITASLGCYERLSASGIRFKPGYLEHARRHEADIRLAQGF
jgi:tetratricopeptide (TPR) repeat protein